MVAFLFNQQNVLLLEKTIIMKSRFTIAVFCLFLIPANSNSFRLPLVELPIFGQVPPKENSEIKWMTLGDAVAQQKLDRSKAKKIMVYVYTDWCRWCKKMEKVSFIDQSIIKMINDNFYAVKFDAEHKEDIVLFGTTFKFVNDGTRGYHELAFSLLEGQLAYPAIVYFNEKMERILIAPGYVDVDELRVISNFIVGNYFLTTTFEEFKKNQTKK